MIRKSHKSSEVFKADGLRAPSVRFEARIPLGNIARLARVFFELKREKTKKSLVVFGFPEIHAIQTNGTEQLAK